MPVLFVDGKQPLTLRRKRVVSASNDRLRLVVAHVPDGPLPGIELRADGVAVVPRSEERPGGRPGKPSVQLRTLPASAAVFAKGPKRQAAQAGRPVEVQPLCLLRACSGICGNLTAVRCNWR